MEYPCVVIRFHEDGRLEIDKDILLTYPDELEMSVNGYITLILTEDEYTDVYIVSHTHGVVKCFLEGFLLGRNADYIDRKSLKLPEGYKALVEETFERLVMK